MSPILTYFLKLQRTPHVSSKLQIGPFDFQILPQSILYPNCALIVQCESISPNLIYPIIYLTN